MELDKQEIKVIAQVLIAKTGENFDVTAFEDCEDFLNEEEVQKICSEIRKICTSTLKRINKKYELNLGAVNSTKEVIEEIIFE